MKILSLSSFDAFSMPTILISHNHKNVFNVIITNSNASDVLKHN